MTRFRNDLFVLALSQALLGLCLLFGQTPVFATEGSLPLEIKNYPRQLLHSRHDERVPGGHDHQVKQQEYNELNGMFVGGTIGTRIGYGYRGCETLLNEQQGYAIDKMGNTSYLEKEEADFYMKLGTSISPDQVSFFEMLRTVPNGAPILSQLQERNKTPEYYRGEPFEKVRTASLWSVAGQRLTPRLLRSEVTPLPWQLEKEWATEAAKLDRRKYKMVWEWGRAAQDVSGDIEPLYRANAMANLKDMIAGNGDIDSSYVMFHSLKKVNTILYERAFPNSRFSSKSEENVLFLVPLRKVLERYPPSGVSMHVAQMKAIAGTVDEVDLVKIIGQFRNLFWDELDLYNGRDLLTVPIVASEWSQIVITHSLLGIFTKHNVPQSARTNLANYMIKNIIPSHHNSNLGQYMDVTDVPTSAQTLWQTDTLQLSNIPAEVAANPKMLLRILIGAYYYKLKQLADLEPKTTPDPGKLTHDRLLQQNYKIAISTWDKKTAEKLQSLGGELKSTQLDQPDFKQTKHETNVGDYWIFRAHFQPLYTVSFTIPTLFNLAVSHPKIDEDANGVLREGWHQIYHKLREMELL